MAFLHPLLGFSICQQEKKCPGGGLNVRKLIKYMDFSLLKLHMVTSTLLYLRVEPWHDPTYNWRFA